MLVATPSQTESISCAGMNEVLSMMVSCCADARGSMHKPENRSRIAIRMVMVLAGDAKVVFCRRMRWSGAGFLPSAPGRRQPSWYGERVPALPDQHEQALQFLVADGIHFALVIHREQDHHVAHHLHAGDHTGTTRMTLALGTEGYFFASRLIARSNTGEPFTS